MPMSSASKRYLAIGIVVIVIVGAGIGAWWILTPKNPQYQTPGAPAGVAYDRIIRIGILDPMTDIQGDAAWNGAYLAAYEINSAGGVDVNGTIYYVGIIAENTYESDAMLDVSKGVAAAQKILSVDQAQYIIGGFRTESLKSYLEFVMDAKKVFIGTGAATDLFCGNVFGQPYSSYTRYKYWFRNMPINSTSLAGEVIKFLGYVKQNMTATLGYSVKNWSILRENLDWTIPMAAALNSSMQLFGWSTKPMLDLKYPITATADDFGVYLNQLQAAGTQVLIPIISAQGGILMTTKYNETKPNFLMVGIDVQSQLGSYFADTGGKCGYEVVMQATGRTAKTPYTIPFWDHFVGNFSKTPLYTGVGSYDAVYQLTWGIKNVSSFISDRVVTALEKPTKADPRIGAGGVSFFTRSHDIFEGYPYGYTMFVQWRTDGTKVVVPTGPVTLPAPPITVPYIIYPSSLATGLIELPPWGINH